MTNPLPDDFQLNPQSPEFDRDPYPILAMLREREPVHWWSLANAWVLTRQGDVASVMADEARFSPDFRLWEGYVEPPEEHRDHPLSKMRESNLLAYEGAEHTRLRKLASVALTRRAVRNLEPLMHQLIEDLLGRVKAKGECDFVDEIASIYPVAIVSRLLGVEANSDRERRFKELTDTSIQAFSPTADDATKLRAVHAGTQQLEIVQELMELKRRQPGDDLMTDMIQAEAEGDRFTPEEVVGTIMAILVAGSETTANSMAFGLLALLRHPDQLAMFRDDPSCRANAVHEIVRYEMPGRFLNRVAKQDVELRGEKIRKGQLVLCSVAAGQRDPEYVDRPDEFDITRTPKDATAFGIGRHFCLGAQLARLELDISLGRVVESLPNLRLADPDAAVRYRSSPVVRGPASLPIRFDPA